MRARGMCTGVCICVYLRVHVCACLSECKVSDEVSAHSYETVSEAD